LRRVRRSRPVRDDGSYASEKVVLVSRAQDAIHFSDRSAPGIVLARYLTATGCALALRGPRAHPSLGAQRSSCSLTRPVWSGRPRSPSRRASGACRWRATARPAPPGGTRCRKAATARSPVDGLSMRARNGSSWSWTVELTLTKGSTEMANCAGVRWRRRSMTAWSATTGARSCWQRRSQTTKHC
jgi:hypothetical protein